MPEEISTEFLDSMKIESKVFDKRTLFAIVKLMKKKVVKTVESTIKEGKESVVISAKSPQGKWLALKIYRSEHVDFKSMWKYLVGDPRFSRVRKERWAITTTWCRREFKNLTIATAGDVNCPEPIAVQDNILVMGFVGEEGLPAPNLLEIKMDYPQGVYDTVVEEMKKLAKINLIHTDLSMYNILFYDKPYLIDFSQAVTERHPLAKEFLKKDVYNINTQFKKLGVEVNKNLFEEIVQMMRLK